MSYQGGSTQGGQTDQVTNFFWLLCLIIGVGLVIWWLRPQWFVLPVFAIRRLELDLLVEVDKAIIALGSFLHLSFISKDNIFLQLKEVVTHVDPATLKFKEFMSINEMIGNWMRYPLGAILIGMGFWAMTHHTSARFRTSYSMDQLKKAETDEWPQITPVSSLDLVSEDLDQGEWAMGKTPLDWSIQHEVLEIKQVDDKKVYALREQSVYDQLAMQLGLPISNLSKSPIHVKALLVIFIARAEKKRDISGRFLKQISRSAGGGKLDFSGVEEQFELFRQSKVLKWSLKRHAYINTLMGTMLELARSDGVLASAEFLWLKPVDRCLWYMLNSMGRQTAMVEVSGCFAHWLAERQLKRGIKTPMVKQAVQALGLALADILHEEEGESWHSSAA